MALWVTESKGANGAPSIVFLHGLGMSSWMWQAQLEGLRHHYHCLAIDLPGNGESHQVEWRSFQDSAAQVAETIRQRTPLARRILWGCRWAVISGCRYSPLNRMWWKVY